MSAIGQNLRRLRLEKGLSQKALAKLAGVSQTLIASLEKETYANTKKLPEIARALGVKPDAIDSRFAENLPAAMDDDRPSQTLLHSGGLEKYIPVFGSAQIENRSVKASSFIRLVSRPDYMAFAEGAYGLVITDPEMIPEFNPGDIALIDPDQPILPATTAIILSNQPNRYVIRRIESFDADHWHTLVWSSRSGVREVQYARSEWPTAERVMAKIYRG